MKALNNKATEIFCNLIDLLDDEGYVKINMESLMPLVFEEIADEILTPWGTGKLYSLCHFYKQNGDVMVDPEMCFIAVDNRTDAPNTYELVRIIPYMFCQANLGIDQESVTFEGRRLFQYMKRLQFEHAEFADQWLVNIQQHGYLGNKQEQPKT